MKGKWFMLAIVLFFTVAVVSACGDKDNNDNNNNNNEEVNAENEENDNNENDNDENDEEEIESKLNDDNNDDNDDADEANADVDSEFDEMIEYMEEETEGTAEVLYENNDGQEHEMEGVTVSLDAYTLVELNDFNEWFDIKFDDQTDGGVIIAQYTVTNDTDDDVHFMPAMSMSYVGADKAFDNYRDLLPEDEQLPVKLSPDDDYELEAGDEVTGYYTYTFGKDRLENEVLEEGVVEVEVAQPQEDMDDFSTRFGDEGTFTLSLDADSAEANAEKESQGFYEDRASSMGDKEMIEEESDIGDSQELGDVGVTLDGYQITEFEPNSDEAARFDSFENGIVLMTIKFDLDNDGDSEIGLGSISSKLTVNDGSLYMLDEKMLHDYDNDDVVETDDSGELLQVYAFDKRDYEDWEDRGFEIEVGPLKDKDAKDISKGKKAEFDLK